MRVRTTKATTRNVFETHLCPYPEKTGNVSVPSIACGFIIQSIVEQIRLRDAWVYCSIIQVETMVEITILLDIREQAVYLGQEDMVFGEFKPSLQNYNIGKFCVITFFLSQLSKNSKEETNFVLCSQRYWQTFRAENARFGIAKR